MELCIKSDAKNGQMISEVIVRGKRNIKQNGNCLYFNLAIESSSFIFNNFKTEKFKLTLRLKQTNLSFVSFYQCLCENIWFFI